MVGWEEEKRWEKKRGIGGEESMEAYWRVVGEDPKDAGSCSGGPLMVVEGEDPKTGGHKLLCLLLPATGGAPLHSPAPNIQYLGKVNIILLFLFSLTNKQLVLT